MTFEDLNKIFSEQFGDGADRIGIVSPGRVNYIGEHTDYNDGFVLPGAVGRATRIVIAPGSGRNVRLYAANLKARYEGTLDDLETSPQGWPNYVIGVAAQFVRRGLPIGGFDAVYGSDIPVGAGLSSSASVEAGFSYAMNLMFDLNLDKMSLAFSAQRAEHEFVGVLCGIMDQFTNLFGAKNKLLKLDCRSLEFEYIPFERQDLCTVLLDTQVRRELAMSEYNVRRQQCAAGVEILSRHVPGIKALRDVAFDDLDRFGSLLHPVILNRCRFVLEENLRVQNACDDLMRGDYASFGVRMFASHAGLRDLYEVSCPELDTLVEIASQCKGVLGARMMGAGFGGCTVNLVDERRMNEFIYQSREEYRARMKTDIGVIVTTIESGTHAVSL